MFTSVFLFIMLLFYVISGNLFSIMSLRFVMGAFVSDDIFCFLVCFAMLVALCWIISVMFLFSVYVSISSSAANLFFSSIVNK